jgi:hypothetical protein
MLPGAPQRLIEYFDECMFISSLDANLALPKIFVFCTH